MEPIGVYIHIPFCMRKCAYCDFLSAPAPRLRQQEYVAALKKEIEHESGNYRDYQVTTIFLGGGTPSILMAEEITGVLGCIRTGYNLGENAEITMEMNPGTASPEKLHGLKRAGINRLSIGLQSADDRELELLGRIHTYEDFLQTYKWAREAGFGNINVDLMSGLPGQHMEGWVRTLETVLALSPEHISAYSLILEEGTRLNDRINEYPCLPDEEEDRQMYQETKRLLAAHGYQRYEISNYAKDGYACRHNQIYWQRGAGHVSNYVGFGLGASSTVETVRWQNTGDMAEYLKAFSKTGNGSSNGIKKDVQQLSAKDCMEEYMFLVLRMMCGVSKAAFYKSFGDSMDEIYGNIIKKWADLGMLTQEGDSVKLTDAGVDVSNVVLADFLL